MLVEHDHSIRLNIMRGYVTSCMACNDVTTHVAMHNASQARLTRGDGEGEGYQSEGLQG